MSRLHDLERHRQGLSEIRDIMNSMKTLAYMETRKLSRRLEAQRAVVESIEEAAADLLSFYPETLPATRERRSAYLLIGTERGFCGDFNHALVRYLESYLETHPTDRPLLLCVGRKLSLLLAGDSRVAASIEGASVVEEIGALLVPVVGELGKLQLEHGALSLHCLYHEDENRIEMKRLLPPFQELAGRPARFPHPPVLNQPQRVLLSGLSEHYLFSVLHEVFYTSHMAENCSRVTHLAGALSHLDDEAEKLTRKYNTLRQEEIIEEIEVILLSAGNLPGIARKS
jgi:F-type H+-transporting ATPase subunit gamma